jgi:hypothetical protein
VGSSVALLYVPRIILFACGNERGMPVVVVVRQNTAKCFVNAVTGEVQIEYSISTETRFCRVSSGKKNGTGLCD